MQSEKIQTDSLSAEFGTRAFDQNRAQASYDNSTETIALSRGHNEKINYSLIDTVLHYARAYPRFILSAFKPIFFFFSYLVLLSTISITLGIFLLHPDYFLGDIFSHSLSLGFPLASVVFAIAVVIHAFGILLFRRQAWSEGPERYYLYRPTQYSKRLTVHNNQIHFGFLPVQYRFNDSGFFVVGGNGQSAAEFDFSLIEKVSSIDPNNKSGDPRYRGGKWSGALGTPGIRIDLKIPAKTIMLIHGAYFEGQETSTNEALRRQKKFLVDLSSHI